MSTTRGMLSFPPLFHVGKTSYSLILALSGHCNFGRSFWCLGRGAAVVISLGVATESYEFLEMPLLRMKNRFASKAAMINSNLHRSILLGCAISCAVLAPISLEASSKSPKAHHTTR